MCAGVYASSQNRLRHNRARVDFRFQNRLIGRSPTRCGFEVFPLWWWSWSLTLALRRGLKGDHELVELVRW
jgi:hypothetical protein